MHPTAAHSCKHSVARHIAVAGMACSYEFYRPEDGFQQKQLTVFIRKLYGVAHSCWSATFARTSTGWVLVPTRKQRC